MPSPDVVADNLQARLGTKRTEQSLLSVTAIPYSIVRKKGSVDVCTALAAMPQNKNRFMMEVGFEPTRFPI